MIISKTEAKKRKLQNSKICKFHQSNPDQQAVMYSCEDCLIIREPCGCDEYSSCEACEHTLTTEKVNPMETNEELSKRTGQPNDVAFYQQHKESCDRLMEVARIQERDIITEREKIHEIYHELNDIGIEIKARSEGYKKGQKDTVKQIFADLEQVAWQQIEPAKLKQFYKEFSEAKDEQAALEIAKKYSVIGFSAEKFDAIKKQYGVE